MFRHHALDMLQCGIYCIVYNIILKSISVIMLLIMLHHTVLQIRETDNRNILPWRISVCNYSTFSVRVSRYQHQP